jgi:PAS domain S-box-containing protein
MGKTPMLKSETEDLRLRAEKIAESIVTLGSQEGTEAPVPNGYGLLLHELLVNKLELEMQNEELRRAQAELDVRYTRYFDLHDISPSGYCSVSEDGRILAPNLTAATLLCVPRGALVNQSFARFILGEDRGVYLRMQKLLLETGEAQACELRMIRQDQSQFWAGLSATVAIDEAGVRFYRLFINDVSDRRRAEEELRRMAEEKKALLRKLSAGERAT